MMAKEVWLSAKVEKELKQEFRKIAKQKDTDASKLLRQIVREFIQKEKTTPKN